MMAREKIGLFFSTYNNKQFSIDEKLDKKQDKLLITFLRFLYSYFANQMFQFCKTVCLMKFNQPDPIHYIRTFI